MSKAKSICWLCDEQWPMSRNADEAGEHVVEADGVTGTMPCRRPEEYAKFQERKRQETQASDLWHEAKDRWPGSTGMRDHYYKELLIAAGILVPRKPDDPKALPCGWPTGGKK